MTPDKDARPRIGENLDSRVVAGFGDEWERFDQTQLDTSELLTLAKQYFSIFPWHLLPPNASGFDAGCGSGRWAKIVAPRVARLTCVDASEGALNVAKRNLAGFRNVVVLLGTVQDLPIPIGSQDFGYSLGVLHHVPDTAGAIGAVVTRLKPGAPLLLYLYYAFDNRPVWYRLLWSATNALRRGISRAPHNVRYVLSQLLAGLVYFPLARGCLVAERLGISITNFPLSYYRDKSFYVMRTDSLDRFGTSLEHRFTRAEIERMMLDAGLRDIRFSEEPPYWCVVGIKA